MKKILFLLIFILASITVNAQMWYVDESGSDVSGNGSITKPWASLSHAADTISSANGFSSDTIYINSGSYTDNNQVVLSVGISILGNSTSRPTITTNYHNVSGSISYPYIKGASTTGESVNGNQFVAYVNFNGDDTASYVAMAFSYRNNVKIHHCNVDDFKYYGIAIWGSAAALDNTVPITYPTTFSTGCEIYDCIITNCSMLATYGDGGIFARGVSGLKIYNNTLDQRDRTDGYNGDNLRIYNSKGVKIYNNTFYRKDDEGTAWKIFFEIHNSMGGMECYDNIFYGMATADFSGVIIGDYDYGWKIYGNTFQTLSGSHAPHDIHATSYICIEAFDINEYVYIYQNYFKKGYKSILIDNSKTRASNIYVNYNIIEDIGNTTNAYSLGIQAITYVNNKSSPTPFNDIHINNNVITASTVQSNSGIAFNLSGDITNLDVCNNIVYGNSNIYYPIYFSADTAIADIINANINKNILYGNDNDSIYYNRGAELITWTDLNDTDDKIVDDPLFVGTGTPPADYKLQATSPAKDAGISVGLTSDYGGYSVPVGSGPDIGAWEYGADVDPPNWTEQGIGWDRMQKKVNFRDTVNFTRGFMIAGVPISSSGSGLEILGGLEASVDDLNATAGATGNFQGQINSIVASTVDDSKADTSLSNLSSVAINTHLLPDTAGTINLGSGAKPFGKIFGTATQISSLMVGDSTSNTIAKFDSVAVFNDKLYAFIAGDTVGWGILTADSEDITDHVIMLTDTTHTNGKHILYTQWQVDSIFAGFTSGFDSVYIYAKVDSLINVVGEQQSQIDLLWAAIDSLGLGDFNPPSFLSAEVGTFNDSILVVILNDTDVQQDSIPAVGAFTVKENGSAMGIEAVDIGNDTIYISLDALAIEGYTYKVSYNKDFDYPQLQDSSENITPSWTDRTVTNNVFDAFPSIVSVTETLTNNSDRTSHPITMPATVEEGDLLLVFFASDATSGLTYSIDTDNSDAGWTLESYTAVNTAGAIVLWKVADADGDTLTITTSDSQISVAQTYRITNFDPVDPIQAVHYNGPADQYPDPPAATGDYGADDYLWIVSYGGDGYTSFATAAPADFTGLETTYIESAGACSVNTAWRKYNVNGAYDPGTFTATATDEEWIANTVIVNPIQ